MSIPIISGVMSVVAGRNKDHYAVTLVDKMREHIEHKDPVLDGAKAT